ncbi:MAG: hypothetical protein ACLP7J_19960 [Streptosporangiaceae bacterium]
MSHDLWLGLFIGLLLGFIGWSWLRLGLLLLAGIVLADQYHWFSKTSSGVHLHSSGITVLWIVVVVIALLIGLSWGRLRGLQHLGRAEMTTRWTNVRGVSRW